MSGVQIYEDFFYYQRFRPKTCKKNINLGIGRYTFFTELRQMGSLFFNY